MDSGFLDLDEASGHEANVEFKREEAEMTDTMLVSHFAQQVTELKQAMAELTLNQEREISRGYSLPHRRVVQRRPSPHLRDLHPKAGNQHLLLWWRPGVFSIHPQRHGGPPFQTVPTGRRSLRWNYHPRVTTPNDGGHPRSGRPEGPAG